VSYLEDWAERRDERREQRLRQLGTRTPRCSRPGCNETDPFALTGVDPEIVCYECQSEQRGRSIIEAHHLAGRHNDPATTVDLLGNDHRALNDLQCDWPRHVLRNPDGSPLLHAAAAVRGWLDVLALVLERAVGWVPEFLEWLDDALRTAIGPRWWDDLSWEY
jgi:hypothetical protein